MPTAISGSPIFAPMLAMWVLTFIVWIYMYARRIPFILQSDLSDEQMTPLGFMQLSPAAVANPSDNLKNLFEMPVLFYVAVLYLFVTQQVDNTYVMLAWAYVVFRYLHSLMHCTYNIVIVRFWIYAASSVALFGILGRAVLAYVG